MEINEEIFEEFFRKLEEDENIPHSIIEELKTLCRNWEDITREKIFEVIKRGSDSDGED